MENFKEIAEKCLVGELSGTFVLRNGDKCISSNLKKDQSLLTSFRYLEHFYYSDCGHCYMSTGRKFKFDIIDFIPDNMQEQIKIDVPEGKVPVMEQTEDGVVITWKEKELSYNDIEDKLPLHIKIKTQYFWDTNVNECDFSKKVEVMRKLINIKNCFGKPNSHNSGYCISYNSYNNKFYVSNINTIGIWTKDVVFAEKEHAEQAIKMLGDELKYLFEPW